MSEVSCKESRNLIPNPKCIACNLSPKPIGCLTLTLVYCIRDSLCELLSITFVTAVYLWKSILYGHNTRIWSVICSFTYSTFLEMDYLYTSQSTCQILSIYNYIIYMVIREGFIRQILYMIICFYCFYYEYGVKDAYILYMH